jgi:hypothetical protein
VKEDKNIALAILNRRVIAPGFPVPKNHVVSDPLLMDVNIDHPEGVQMDPFTGTIFNPFGDLTSEKIDLITPGFSVEVHGEFHDGPVRAFPIHDSRIHEERGSVCKGVALPGDTVSNSGCVQVKLFDYPTTGRRAIADFRFRVIGVDKTNPIANIV